VVFQIQLAKSQTTLPLTRYYIRERESEIADSAIGTRRQA
jgi:hypothetical protein